jgi:hypothetical protein
MWFNKHRGCFYSPPLFKTNENKDEPNTIYDYSMVATTEEQRVHTLIHKYKLNQNGFRFSTYVDTQTLQDEQTIFRFKKHPDETSLDSNLHLHRSPKEFIHIFIYSFIYLCDTLTIMQNNQLIHGHLNLAENILVQKENANNHPIIADFSLTVKDILNQPYFPQNVLLPFECHVFNYIHHHRLKSISEQNIDDIVYDVFCKHSLFSTIFSAEYAIDAHAYLMPCVNLPYENIVQYILGENANHTKTWDTFGLCANYLSLILEFHGAMFYKPHIEICIQMFSEAMHPNPKHRVRHTPQTLKTNMNRIFCCKRI